MKRAWCAGLTLLVACGSRTGLVVDESAEVDAGFDAPIDVTLDTKVDAPFDGSFDVPRDITVDSRPDVFRNDCPDADATFIYVATQPPQLYSFYPPDGSFTRVGALACPAPSNDTVFSMAVDRKGAAYVLYYDPTNPNVAGPIFRVSTATAACLPIPYAPGQDGFTLFGMGYATNGGGPSETLYLMGSPDFQSAPGLAALDTATFKVTPIGSNSPALQGAELTGTGDGRLYSFYFYDGTNPIPYLGEIDKTNGHVLGEVMLSGVSFQGGFAVAFWGGDFYLFTAPGGSTDVTRYRPTDHSMTVVATLPGAVVVGAGVSTCAPQ